MQKTLRAVRIPSCRNFLYSQNFEHVAGKFFLLSAMRMYEEMFLGMGCAGQLFFEHAVS